MLSARKIARLQITVPLLASAAKLALAGLPNAHTRPMEHIMVSMNPNNGLHTHVMTDASNPVEMLRFDGETYDTQGLHHASYEVFVGVLSGNPLDGFTSGFIDLNFIYGPDLSDRIGSITGSIGTVPAPGALSVLAIGAIFGGRRRR